MRSRTSGFVSHPIVGAQFGLMVWVAIGFTFFVPRVQQAGLGAVPILAWVALVAGGLTAAFVGLTACEVNLLLQLVGLGIAYFASQFSASIFAPIGAAMIPSVFFLVWMLVDSFRK